jgi:cytoskeleton-associated protein 5
LNDSNVPKIKGGDFMGIAKMLKKTIGDSNTVVSSVSVKVCGNLAKGLRKEFEPCCKELLSALIAKFREKKTSVIEETNITLTNFLLCTNLENLLPELVPAFTDKAPSVKKNVCDYISKAAQETYIDALQRISAEILTVLIKATDDP